MGRLASGTDGNGCEHRFVDKGEMVCARCGLVQGSSLSFLPSRDPDGDGEPRNANSVLRHDGGLGTELYTIRDKNGFSSTLCAQWTRLVKYNNQVGGKERRLRNILCEAARVCSYMELPHIARERTCWMLKRFKGGDYTLKILADFVYVACRSLSSPRTLEEIDKTFGELYGKSYRSLQRGRMTRINNLANGFGFVLPAPTVHDYIGRFAWKIGQPEIAQRAHQIADTLNNFRPTTRATHAVTLAKEEITHNGPRNVSRVEEITHNGSFPRIVS